jgi:5,10-methylenetetrahydromethanopterin reductase
VKASLRLNNDLPAGRLVEIALLAEADGFDAIWVSHDLFLRSAPVLLAVLARETTRIGIGSCVFNPYSAHPAELAMTAATLQEVSGGRFRLGLAAGDATFLGWAGIRRPRPLARTREALLAVRALLEGGRPAESDGAGPGWRPEGWLRGGPAPTPIHLGAMSPRMLELADGALALLFPPEHYPVAAGHVRAGLARAGRDPAAFDLPACVWCSVDLDDERARLALAAKLAYYGPSIAPWLLAGAGLRPDDFAPVSAALAAGGVDAAARLVTPAMLRLGIAGGAEEVLERCRWLRAQGATQISFGPPLGPRPAGRGRAPRARGAPPPGRLTARAPRWRDRRRDLATPRGP